MNQAFVSIIFAAGSCAALGGCATGNGEVPLVFGSSNVYGVSIGGGVNEAAGEFVVGYKGLDVAIIPVSAPEAGAEVFLGARAGKGHVDSYSVLGQFGATASRRAGSASAGLGKFFATGMAAQNIARGFAKKMGYGRSTVVECRLQTGGSMSPPAAPEPAASVVSRPAGMGPAREGARLVFGQQVYLAAAIDASALDSGVKLTLGSRDRNFAFVPTIGRDAAGKLVWLEAGSPGATDALSVLGQFEANASVGGEDSDAAPLVRTAAESGAPAPGVSSGLGKFFSTGAAARILSDGFNVKLCEEYVSSAPQPRTNAGSQQAGASPAQPAKLVETEVVR